jgi:hypothetical protein
VPDVARSVVVVVDQLLRQDEVVRLDVVEDGDDGLKRLVERGELAEAVVGDAVVPGEDGHSDAAPAAARGVRQQRWLCRSKAAVARGDCSGGGCCMGASVGGAVVQGRTRWKAKHTRSRP